MDLVLRGTTEEFRTPNLDRVGTSLPTRRVLGVGDFGVGIGHVNGEGPLDTDAVARGVGQGGARHAGHVTRAAIARGGH